VTIEKVAPVAPGATSIGPTGDANELLLPSTTGSPDEGAGPLRVTVPDAELPPRRDVGLTDTEETVRVVLTGCMV
jgi:hypothetical protein